MNNLIYYFLWTRRGKKMRSYEGDVAADAWHWITFKDGDEFITSNRYIHFDNTTTPPTLVKWTTTVPVSPRHLARLPQQYIDQDGNLVETSSRKVLMYGGGDPFLGAVSDNSIPPITWTVKKAKP